MTKQEQLKELQAMLRYYQKQIEDLDEVVYLTKVDIVKDAPPGNQMPLLTYEYGELAFGEVICKASPLKTHVFNVFEDPDCYCCLYCEFAEHQEDK